MQEAKILHLEQNEEVRDEVEDILIVRGVHRVIAAAGTIGEATERLEAVARRHLKANVILLGSHLAGALAVNHPKFIRDRIKEFGLEGLPVVGLSEKGLAERGLVLGQDIISDLTIAGLGKNRRLLDHVLDELD